MWRILGKRLKDSRRSYLEEIRKNDFNLNVTLCVSPQKEVEEVDIPATWAAIRDVEEELLAVGERIAGHLKEISAGVSD